MGGCSVLNCSHHSRYGFRVFIFPRDPERRAKWLQMCRRDKWQPTPYSVICEVHFEESQFESCRKDGWKKLKPNAIPTLFNVPNCPKPITPRRRIIKRSIVGVDRVESEVAADASCEPETSTSLAESLLLVPDVSHSEDPTQEESALDTKVSDGKAQPSRIPKKRKKDVKRRDLSSRSTPTSKCAKDFRPLRDLAAGDKNSLTKERRVLPLENTQGTKNQNRRRKQLKTDEDEVIEYIEELEARKRASLCAVCSRTLENVSKECLATLTSTTGLSLLQCLIEISGNKSTKIKEYSPNDMVCHYCAHLINYADKLNVELAKLKAAINGCLQIKSLSEEDQEMLKPQFDSHLSILDEFSDRVVGPGSAAGRGIVTEKSPDDGMLNGMSEIVIQDVVSLSEIPEPILVKENIVNSVCKKTIQKNESDIPEPVLVNANIVNSQCRNPIRTKLEKVRAHRPESSDPFTADSHVQVCKICNFRTSSSAVLFFHLRRHMANHQWCDFCDKPLIDEPEAKKQRISEDPT